MAQNELVEVRQVLPRRVRLRAPLLAQHREVCERVAHAIADEGHFAVVRVRPETGSVIVEDENEAIPAKALASRLAELLRGEHDEANRPLTAPLPRDPRGPTRIARAVVHAVIALNDDVRERLDRRADIGTLMPVFFAALGIAEVHRTKKLPVPAWFNLLWWSLRSFMTFNIRAMAEAGEAEGNRVNREKEAADPL